MSLTVRNAAVPIPASEVSERVFAIDVSIKVKVFLLTLVVYDTGKYLMILTVPRQTDRRIIVITLDKEVAFPSVSTFVSVQLSSDLRTDQVLLGEFGKHRNEAGI